MFNRYMAVAIMLTVGPAGGSAYASACGEKATAMLRYYNTRLSNPTNPTATGGAASTNSARVGAVPVTTEQQRKASTLVEKAASEDKTGNVDGCTTDLGAADTIIKYNN